MKKIIFGTMDINKENYISSIKCAGDCGYEIIDTAWIYDNEKEVGEAVRDYNFKNERQLKLQTKVWTDFFDNTYNQVLNQLETLGVDKIYSVLLHRPSWDFSKTITAWNDLIRLKNEGFISKIGVSNFENDMIEVLWHETNVKPEINQIELSVLNFRSDRVNWLKSNSIEIQCWSPMGKDNLVLKNEKVLSIAKDHNVSEYDVALSFLSSQNLNVVVKSETENHIKSNYKSQELILTPDDIEQLLKENKFLNKFEVSYPLPYK